MSESPTTILNHPDDCICVHCEHDRKMLANSKTTEKYISLDEAMAYLYHHEINTRIDCFWDGGFNVMLGDHMNGFSHGELFEADDLYKAGDWLIAKAREKYPKCEWRPL